jgi:hypothetical protein
MSAALPAVGGAGTGDVAPFPPGLWTLYFHDPTLDVWTSDSYDVITVIDSWTSLWGTLKMISDDHLLTGMYFLMKDPTPPQWEHSMNSKGGTYQIKVATDHARETFEVYCAAAIMKAIAVDDKNIIKGVSISSKKGQHNMMHNIIKLWNNDAKTFNKDSDVNILSHITGEIIYFPSAKKRW